MLGIWNAVKSIGSGTPNTSGDHPASGLAIANKVKEEALNHENRGDLHKAKNHYEVAINEADGLYQNQNAKTPQLEERLAALCFYYGNFLRKQGDKFHAERHFQRALTHAGGLDLEQPEAQELFKQITARYGSFVGKEGNQGSGLSPLDHRALKPLANYSSNRSKAGSPSYLKNPAFEAHLSSLSPCTQPFLTQPLQTTTSTYVLPQSNEAVQNTHHLAWCLQQNTASEQERDVWIREAKQVVEEFKHLKSKDLAHIQEVIALSAIDHPELHRNITNALLDALKLEKNRLLNLPLLRGLSVMVMQRPYLTHDIHSAGDSVMLLRALLGALQRIHADQNLEQTQTLLHILSLLLDQMVYFGAKEIDRVEIEEPLRRALRRFEDKKKYPELAWPIEYAFQALERLPNNEKFSEALIRRALPALGGLSYLTTFGLKIASAEIFISGFEPDKVWEAYQCFKDAFGEIEWLRRAPWYGELCFIDVLIGMGRLDLLGKLLAKNTALREEAYLRGLCDRLERIACFQDGAHSQDHALKLLKGFKEGQITWAKQESIQQYARQSLDRIGLMWPKPNLATMEKEGYAPAAWHPFWAAIPDSALISKIQNKIQKQANQEAALSQIAAIHNSVYRFMPPSVSQTMVRNALHRYYDASDLSIQRVSGEKASLDNCYINLAIVESQAQREKDQDELKKQALAFERLPSSERVDATNPNRLIPLEKLFEKQKLRDGSEGIPQRILIHGRAGIGKTTLCKKLVHKYHHNGLWRDQFDCMVWVPLRQLKTAPAQNLENLLCQYFSIHGSTQAQALAKAFQENHRDKTLFILDGLDEVTEGLDKRHALNTFLESLLNQVHVLITSRPAGVSASQCNELDLELETIGFNTDDVRTYIQKFAPESKQTEIQRYIDRMPLIQELVNIPIQLDALCYSWDKLPKNQEVTMAMLYEAMVDKLWRKDSVRLEKKEGGQLLTPHEIEDLSESELKEVMAAEIDYLSYLAFKGLEAEKIEFSREELKQRRSELNEGAASGEKLPINFTTNLKKASYLHTADANRPEAERRYHFLHLTFQEFFAAKFLVKHLQAYTDVDKSTVQAYGVQKNLDAMPKRHEVEAFIATHKYNPRYEIVWWMVAGLLEGALLERFFRLLEQAPRDLIGVRHQQVLMGCLNEARNQLNNKMHAGLEKELTQWLHFEMKWSDKWSKLGRRGAFPEYLLLRSLDKSDDRRKQIIQTLGARPALSEAAERALAGALQDQDENVRNAAALVLSGKNSLSEAAEQALIGALQDQEGIVRATAARTLGGQNPLSEAAEQALIDTLQDQEGIVRATAARTLGGQNPLSEVAVQALISALQDQDENVMTAAANALGSQSPLSEATEQALIGACQHENWRVRAEAARALGSQSPLSEAIEQALIGACQDQESPVRNVATHALESQGSLSEAAEQALVDAFQHENGKVGIAAACTLGKQSMLSKAAVQALIGALQHENGNVRFAATRAFENQKTLSEAAMLALISAFHDQERNVRNAAACALEGKNLFPEAVVWALVGALQHENKDVRNAAARVLKSQNPLSQAAAQALISACQDQDEDADVRAKAARALGNQNPLSEAAEQALIGVLQHENKDVRVEAAGALGSQSPLSETAVQALIGALQHVNWEVRRVAAYTLGKQSPLSEATVQALIGACQDQHGNVRTMATSVLGGQGPLPEAAKQALIGALPHEDYRVGFEAARVLGGQSPLSEAAEQALIDACQHENWRVRAEAARALGGQSPLSKAVVQALIDVCQDRDSYVSNEAVCVLIRRNPLTEAAKQTLVDALQHENWKVRAVAARALRVQGPLSEAAVQALICALQDQDQDVRYAAACALVGPLPEAAVQALIMALQDQERNVKNAAVYALEGQNSLSEEAVHSLIGVLQHENEDVRYGAVRVLSAHTNFIYSMLPGLLFSQIEILYTRFLFNYSCKHVGALYVQDRQLHFYTEKGAGQVEIEEPEKIIKAFEAVQIREGIKLMGKETLLEKEL